MWPHFNSEQWSAAVDQLAAQDWVIIDNALPLDVLQCILSEFNRLEALGALEQAAIGSFDQQQRVDNIRTDWIYWLDRMRDTALSEFFEGVDALRFALARDLFISLRGYEFHLAQYPKGAFYRAHLDQFHHRDNRKFSFVLYLNEHWQRGDGGELQIIQETKTLVEPILNRLILFRSDTVLHEVLTAHKTRRSLTGWLLKQPSDIGILGI